jgi:hypothetical protein
MVDGWALDRSMSLPHLDRMLADADKIIAERAGVQMTPAGTYRSYFQDMWTPEDVERYPSFTDFATSSDLLATVCRYLKTIPVLSGALPHGIRLVESNAAFDAEPDRPKDSQLYHVDYYSQPNVYVLVLLRDTGPDSGPWTFFPRAASRRLHRALNNWGYGVGYRFRDEQVYSVVDRSQEIAFCGPRGTVLFIESSGCFHFGSRKSVKPRFQLMLGYHGACRTDFHEILEPQQTYPVRACDSTLRRLVLDKTYVPDEVRGGNRPRQCAPARPPADPARGRP